MRQHVENDFVLPALFVLFNYVEGIPTEQIKSEISQFISLNEMDMEPYKSRNKNEPRYYQIVGNMISHKNINFFKYVRRIKEEIDGRIVYLLILNEDGKNYISELIEKINKKNFDEHYVEIDKYDQKLISFANNKLTNKYPRDTKLAKQVIEVSNYKCQYALIKNKNHFLFETEDGKKYAEAHHLIPMKASKDFFPKNLDRASNLVCLCPKCHAALHHGSREVKTEILKTLYDKYIEILNDDGIYISFEKLLNKYY